MMTRLAAIFAVVLAVLPLSQAFAQAEHAQRLATEVAQRRAQIRAALCRQHVPQDQLKLPVSPPSGSGGYVPVPACPQPTR